MTEPIVASKARIDALTGLRFFAALAVYLHHHPHPDYLPNWLATLFSAGYNGVTIFFVLSGFVIGFNYFEALGKPTREKILRYGIARFARVYPLYFLILLYVWLTNGAPQTGDIVLHFLTLQAWSPDVRLAYAFNGPGWSIGVEFFLYACFPLICLVLAPLARRKKTLWLLALVVMLAVIGVAVYFKLIGYGDLPRTSPLSAHRWLYRTPLTRLGDFMLGIIAALLLRQHNRPSAGFKHVWAMMSYGAVIAIVALMLLPANLNSAFSWDAAYAPSAFFFILALALVPQTLVARFLGSRLLVLLGESSFALYLIHVPLMDLVDIDRYVGLDPLIAIPLWVVFGVTCIVFSIGLHLFIETPLRRFINSLAERPIKLPSLKTLFVERHWRRSIIQGFGIVLLLTVNVSISRLFWDQALFFNSRVQGPRAFGRYAIYPFPASFANGIQLVEYGVERRNPVYGGEKLLLSLRWACNDATAETFNIQIELQDTNERTWANGQDVYHDTVTPCHKGLGTAKDIVADIIEFSLPVTMPAGEYRVVMTLYDQVHQARVVVYDGTGKELGDQLQIATQSIGKNINSYTASELLIENPFFVDMQEMRFLGYANMPQPVHAGDPLDIGLYWRARGKPRGDYVVTVQMRDWIGDVITEQTARPAGNTYPTLEWNEGEVLLDWHTLTLPNDAPEGEYLLSVLLRDAGRGQIIGESQFAKLSVIR